MNVCIVQARMGACRLPGKVLKEIAGRAAVLRLHDRLSKSGRLERIVYAIPVGAKDDPLDETLRQAGCRVFRGSELDVLDRYYQAARWAGCGSEDLIVRVTADDIVTDPALVDRLVDFFWSRRIRRLDTREGNGARRSRPGLAYARGDDSFPYGLANECFTFAALERAWRAATRPEDREHVSPYIRRETRLFPQAAIAYREDASRFHLSVDTEADLEFNRRIFQRFAGNAGFGIDELVDALKAWEREKSHA